MRREFKKVGLKAKPIVRLLNLSCIRERKENKLGKL